MLEIDAPSFPEAIINPPGRIGSSLKRWKKNGCNIGSGLKLQIRHEDRVLSDLSVSYADGVRIELAVDSWLARVTGLWGPGGPIQAIF